MNSIERMPTEVGNEFGKGLRNTSKYSETQQRMDIADNLDGLLDVTPPVGLNLRLISEMHVIAQLRERIQQTPQEATILGLAIVDGAEDFRKFLHSSLHTTVRHLTIVDIDNTILREVDALHLQNVTTLWKDAQHTELPSISQDMIIRDHLGNCCPPAIDRAIDKEASRITKQGGISLVNITTSDALWKSPHRSSIPFDELTQLIGQTGIDALKNNIFDLSQLKNACGDSAESLRGMLLEIEPQSFVIFGEDADGHGEWFRSWQDHVDQWTRDGFQILEVREREGNDSHDPPLRCHRHNVILIKKGTNV